MRELPMDKMSRSRLSIFEHFETQYRRTSKVDEDNDTKIPESLQS